MTLYVRGIDDASITHAVKSVTKPVPVCNAAQGRTRLDYRIETVFNPATSTSRDEKSYRIVRRPEDVTCPDCTEFLAPKKIKAQVAAPATPQKAKPRTRRPKA